MAKLNLRDEILGLVREFAEGELEPKHEFRPGVDPIPASGKLLSPSDFVHLVDASLDGWLTSGRFHTEFERNLAKTVGVRSAVFVNSGSSANLVALSALTSPKLGNRRLRPGDEVITVAAGFPTTVNPIIQNGLKPVFVDIDLGTYDINVSELEAAITPRTRAIMIAHTLGNPVNLDAVMAIKEKYDLWFVEDACDALGARYRQQHIGSFGDTGTVSFYPAHHITTGEGGAVFVNSPLIKRQVESFRDWGRDCYCPTGEDNTCFKRFGWQLGTLPYGYDHKYTYSHIGYNLKATDMQAALGLSQLQQLPRFIEMRNSNFARLFENLREVPGLILPRATKNSQPSWFGFAITLEDELSFGRRELVNHLNARKIGTRLLFGGNLTRQPGYQGVDYTVASGLRNTDIVAQNTFWVGVHPSLSAEMLDFVAEEIKEFVGKG